MQNQTLLAGQPLAHHGHFQIHEDMATEEGHMMAEHELSTEAMQPEDDGGAPVEDQYAETDTASESSEDGFPFDTNVQHDMENLQDNFPGFSDKYRLIKRIGEGTFSTVYKAEDIQYDQYSNDWDIEETERANWSTPPLRRRRADGTVETRRRPKFVAIKKIYVTSSPARIYNELELLHDLRDCSLVCPLITAFRCTDQVVAILPYFRHADFRDYFRKMTVVDMAIYLRCLFAALKSVHAHNIIHRDIKPTNFLYDPTSQRGVLVDFGLAEREGTDSKPCLCHETPETRKRRVNSSVAAQAGPPQGYPKNDTRSSRRANRAGTRGFRAPEVLFKCTEQTTKIDIWSAGVILLTILSRRFPFFNSADDVEALVEIATIFGLKRMKHAGYVHGCVLETTIPTIGTHGYTLEKIILWSTCRTDGGKDGQGQPLTKDEKLAVDFLAGCLELDPAKRLSAAEALEHPFLSNPDLVGSSAVMNSTEEDEIDMLHE